MNFHDHSRNYVGSSVADGDSGADYRGSGVSGGPGGGRGRGGRTRFRGFRGGFRRGDGRNSTDDRPNSWQDSVDDRFDNKKAGGYRGHPGSFNSFNNNRDLHEDMRDFGPSSDLNRPSGGMGNVRISLSEQNKWNETVMPAKSVISSASVTSQTTLVGRRTNDVEIIVTHKLLTEYAEFIERRLKAGGFNVDLLFPNEDVPLGRVLGNIAGRGTLYALVVTQLSEEHRSVTVNILHGQTQEHRNMPLDDALNMISKNFEAFTKGERAPVIPPPGAVPITSAGVPLGDKHPEMIQSLFKILVENRPLTISQYDKLMAYLQEKKDRLSDTAPTNTKAVLQNRILNILGNKRNPEKPSDLLQPIQPMDPSTSNSPSMRVIQNLVQNQILGSIGQRF